MLRKHDYDISKIEIRQSDIPYRNNFEIGPVDLLLDGLIKYLSKQDDKALLETNEIE